MPVQTRRQSLDSLSTSEVCENQSPPAENKLRIPDKLRDPHNNQRKKRSRIDAGLDNSKKTGRPKKRTRNESISCEEKNQSSEKSKQKPDEKIQIEGVTYFKNDFVYVRMQEICDEDEMAVQKCQVCSCEIAAGNEQVKSCHKCARLVHADCLNDENQHVQNEKTWTCEPCETCHQSNTRHSDTLCERVVDGDQSVYLAQILQFVVEEEEQLVRLKWVYLQNQDDPEISRWSKNLYIKKQNKNQLKSDGIFSHCRCAFLGPDPEAVSNEPVGAVIRKANVVFERLQFVELLRSGHDVFFCVGEFQQKDDDENIFADEEEHEVVFSDHSTEDDDFNFGIEKRNSLTPQNTNRRRRSQGAENLRESFIQKFDQVSFSLNFDDDKIRKNIIKNNLLDKAKQNLTLNFHPEELPCRDAEKQKIKDFIFSAINGKNGCLYISGIPGTGKTATVREVVRVMKQNKQFRSKFEFFEFNGLKLPTPRSLYTQFCEKVCGVKTSQSKAQQAIEDYFTNAQFINGKKNQVITKIVLVDEIDMLVTKNQHILYNLFEWPWRPYSCVSVVTISNTMDLPERLLPRIQSRCTNCRLNFRPYKFNDIEVIIKYRLGKYVDAYDDSCIKLVARKVGTLAGDVRKALELLKRGTELAQAEGKLHVVQGDVQNAIEELYSDPHLQYVCNASILQKLILASIILQKQYGNNEENQKQGNKNKICLSEVIARAKKFCEGYNVKASDGGISMALLNLECVGIIVLNPKGARVLGNVKLNAVEENVVFMLKQDSSVQLFATLSV